MKSFVQIIILLLLGLLSSHALRLSDDTCSAEKHCKQGCCSSNGFCGFGPEFCGPENCVSTCDAKAECGEYAPEGQEFCPLDVCCSEWGFCGTSEAFCGGDCQSGCAKITRPSCSGNSAGRRYTGYYESWSYERPCDAIHPSDINTQPWTHLNYAFAQINSENNTLITMNSYDKEFYRVFTALKSKKPSLKCYLSVGGWDAGGKIFSEMANSTDSRKSFIQSAIATMEEYGFDGIDIDWEYPVADDRGGSKVDFENYGRLLKECREAFGGKYGLTIAVPASYWYLRGFDVQELVKHVDWFNVMSYDIHGTWDGHNEWTQEVVNPHTNLTEISSGLDLLWRNSIPPEKVCLGLAFYGRSFTLDDPDCNEPGCSFRRTDGRNSGGADPGRCTSTSGILSNYEINDILKNEAPRIMYRQEPAVNWISWDDNQWVSFDDARTLKQKYAFANELCLGGTFAWALDLGGPGTLHHPDQLIDGPGLDGADPDGDDSGSGDVYISPDIYEMPDPVVSCVPPCTFILPPVSLESATTITFPPYTTSLLVEWSATSTVTLPRGSVTTSATLTRTIQNTTLTIPPVTTSAIDVWNWEIPKGVDSNGTVVLTSSILPPPFIITEHPPQMNEHPQGTASNAHTDPVNTDIINTDTTPGDSNQVTDPESTPAPPRTTDPVPPPPPGVSKPPPPPPGGSKPTLSPVATRTITPPPFPYTSTTKNADSRFPVISRTVGPPGPTCTSDCGKKCDNFCDEPCELDCGNREDDFVPPGFEIEGGTPPNPGKCRGPDCKNGKCSGFFALFCISFDCFGLDCLDGICIGPLCTITMCGGGSCKGSGCIGDCTTDDRCLTNNCMGFGCTGPDCEPDGTCSGPNCTPVTCQGVDCYLGLCEGPECEQGEDGCDEPQSAPRCTEIVKEIKTETHATTYSTTTHTECSTVTACSVEPTTLTTTSTVDEEHIKTISEKYVALPTRDDAFYDAIASEIEDLQESRDEARFGTPTTITETAIETVIETEFTHITVSATPTPRPPPGSGDIYCFDSGSWTSRAKMIEFVTDFCEAKKGKTLDASDPNADHSVTEYYGTSCVGTLGCLVNIVISVEVFNNCKFTFDGSSAASSVCGKNFRMPIDRCDQTSTEFKQGGTLTNDCEMWSIDPGFNP